MRRYLPYIALIVLGLLCQRYLFQFYHWLGSKWGYFLSWFLG